MSEMRAFAMSAVRDGFAQPGMVDKIFALSTDELCEFWAEVAVTVGDLMYCNLGHPPVAAVFGMVSMSHGEKSGEEPDQADLKAQRVYLNLMGRVAP